MAIATDISGDNEISLSADESQYLTFELAGEHYGVDILKVQEIKGYTAVTRLPNTPEYVKGVLNLRGTIAPIVDLRMKFSMGEMEITSFTVIVVVLVRNRIMGFLVDAVSDVVEMAAKDVHPPPELGSKIDMRFIQGIGNCGENLVSLLDIDHVLTTEEVLQVESVQTEGRTDLSKKNHV